VRISRFVILRHDHPDLHWDLMLEALPDHTEGDTRGGRGEEPTLLTWRLERCPVLEIPIPCERIANHRPAYLNYEGPVSGDRGEVRRWDGGTFEWLSRDERQLECRLRGESLLADLIVCPPTGKGSATFHPVV
jgi:hypothetical protein